MIPADSSRNGWRTILLFEWARYSLRPSQYKGKSEAPVVLNPSIRSRFKSLQHQRVEDRWYSSIGGFPLPGMITGTVSSNEVPWCRIPAEKRLGDMNAIATVAANWMGHSNGY